MAAHTQDVVGVNHTTLVHIQPRVECSEAGDHRCQIRELNDAVRDDVARATWARVVRTGATSTSAGWG